MSVIQAAMLPSTVGHRHGERCHLRYQSGGSSDLYRTVTNSLVWWTGRLALLASSLILFQCPHSGGGVSALSCAACDLTLCPSTSDCPGSLVVDICNCCQVCARSKNQKCGGLFGILGQCDKHLQCFIRPVNGQPITGEEEGICKGKFCFPLEQRSDKRSILKAAFEIDLSSVVLHFHTPPPHNYSND